MKIIIEPRAEQELSDLLIGEVFNHNGEAYMLVGGAGENSTAVAAVKLCNGRIQTFSRHEAEFHRVRDVQITGSEIG